MHSVGREPLRPSVSRFLAPGLGLGDSPPLSMNRDEGSLESGIGMERLKVGVVLWE